MPKERLITFQGKTQSLSAWARELKVWPATLRYRLEHFDPEEAMSSIGSRYSQERVSLYELDGKFYTTKELSELSGVNEPTIRSRLKSLPAKKAIISKYCKLADITFNGKTQTISDWARELGIPLSTLSARLSRMTVSEALTKGPHEKEKKYEYKGEFKTLRELAAQYGINLNTLRARIYKNGINLAAALETPVGSKADNLKKGSK